MSMCTVHDIDGGKQLNMHMYLYCIGPGDWFNARSGRRSWVSERTTHICMYMQ